MGRHDRMLLEPGQDVDGYRVESFVARGGMAVVYKAIDRRLGRPVALKLIAPELAEDTTFRARFVRESELAASLDHPNILPIYQAGEFDGMLYIAMRFVDGEDVDTALRRRHRFTAQEALTIFGAVAGALDAAHARNLVHRDVKPANVLLSGADTGNGSMDLDARHVYLTDFGLTKRSASGTGLTTAGQFLGTIAYVAPEQIGNRPVDHRADVYSLACVLYHALSGVPLFARDDYVAMMWAHISEPPPPLSRLVPGLPSAGDAVLAAALAKEPAHRPNSCGELIRVLRSAYADQLQTPRRPAPAPLTSTRTTVARRQPEPETKPPIKPPARLTAAMAALVVLIGLVGFGLYRLGGTGNAGERTQPRVITAQSAAGEAPPSSLANPTIQAIIPVGAGPQGIVFTPDGKRAYVAESDAHALSVVDTASRKVIGKVSLRDDPQYLAISQDGTRVYAATHNYKTHGGNAVAVVDTKLNKPISWITAGMVTIGSSPYALALSPDGTRLYVPDHDEDTVLVYDTRTNAQVATIPTPPTPHWVAFDPTAPVALIADHDSNQLVVVSTQDNTVSGTIPVGRSPHSVAITPDGSRAFTANYDVSTTTVVDISKRRVVRTIPVGLHPRCVAVAPDGKHAYVATEAGIVTVIDTRTLTVTKRLHVGKGSWVVAIAPDGRTAFVSNRAANNVTVLALTR